MQGDRMATAQLQPPALVWVRPPRQARSQLTLGRILDAAEALLRERSWEETSVAEIARRAGSSVGAFYTRFKDKDALLAELHERFIEEAIATAEGAMAESRWSQASICEIVRELVAFQVKIQEERRGLLHAIAVRAISSAEYQARGMRLGKHLEALFTKLVVARRHEILHPVPVLAAAFAGRLISGVLLQRLLFPAAAYFETPNVSVVEEVTHAALAYLGVFPEDAVDAF
jgi:AcrR family transcriptional regulator